MCLLIQFKLIIYIQYKSEYLNLLNYKIINITRIKKQLK